MKNFCPILSAGANGEKVPCAETCAWWAGTDALGENHCAVMRIALQTRCLETQLQSIIKAPEEK